MKKTILAVTILISSFTAIGQHYGSFMFTPTESIKLEKTSEYFEKLFTTSSYTTFKKVKETTDNLNTTHVTYQQFYNNIPIEGCVVFVHSKNGNIYCVNGQVTDNSKLPALTKALISKQNARNSAIQKTKTVNSSDKPSENVIVKVNKNGTLYYRLAIKVRVESENRMKVSDVYIDAETGEVLNEISLINNIDIAGTAQTMYKGKQNITCDITDNLYSLKDNSRSILTYNATNLITADEPIFYTNNSIDWYIPTFTSVTITSIESGWWSSITDSNPDLYIIIKDENGNQIYKSGYFDDTTPTVTFNLPTPIELKTSGYKIEIWDYDITDADDYGGSVNISNIIKGSYLWNGTNHSGQITISDFPHPAYDAHWGMEKTYDYFKNTFNRNSFDGNSSEIIQLINPPISLNKTLPNNAFAITESPYMMVYGMGDGSYMKPVVALDVMAHEFSHLVTATNGNGGLVYQGESGALNESFSDIFACGAEFYVNINPNWTIGEDVFIPAPFMRSMSEPKSSFLPLNKRQPNTYKQEFWINTSNISEENDFGGVHINSGVQNYWFYLLSQGGSGINDLEKAYQVSGIGINDALKIAYRNLMTYLIPQATFQDACYGTLQATIDLFGKNSSQYLSVENAWKAVGISTPNTLPEVIITQIYGGGGNNGATYKSDFIELYNTTSDNINIGGWCLYYSAATSSATNLKYEFPANTTVKANSYFLVKGGDGTGTQPAWNIAFDVTSTLNLSGSAGKVILLKRNTVFNLSTPPTIEEIVNNVDFMDYVPFGTSAIPIWGSAMSSNTTNTTSARRKYVNTKYQYTKNIGDDFEVVTAEPRNSSITTETKLFNFDSIIVFAVGKTLHIKGIENNQEVEIFNISGLRIYSTKITSNSIPLNNFANGIYIVKVGLRTFKIKL